MEIEKIYPFVLLVLLVGMIIGVGILTMDKFGVATREAATKTNESIVLASNTGTTTNSNVTSISFFGNASNNSVTEFVLNTEVNITTNGVITVDTKIEDGTYNVSYAYTKGNPAYDALEDTGYELSTMASTWIGLIITIFVLATIMFLVIRSFANAR